MVQQKNKNIAIISPNKNAYSETFIQAQKEHLKGEIFYYHGGHVPTVLEGKGILAKMYNKWVFKFLKKFQFTKFTFAQWCIYRSLKHNNIQVVLANYGTTAHAIVEICQAAKVPLVTHFHGYDMSVNKVITDCNYYQKVIFYSSKLIAVSTVMKNKLLQLGAPASKVVYNVYGPHQSFFDLQVKNENSKLFLSIGRFVYKKAPFNLILSMVDVAKKHPTAQLIMVGDGELKEVCENLIKHFNLQNNIQIFGVANREQIMELMEKSVAFIQHSVTAFNGDQEGTPVAILEASAAGLPVISTYHAGIPDVIVPNQTGWLVPEHDVHGMANAMISCLDDPESARIIGKNAKQRIHENFSFNQHIQNLQNVLEESIKK